MKDDIKLLLKEAREAIKNKNYVSAIKTSKQVLKSDKENYTALVFLGVAYQETGDKQKSLLSFNEAVRINPTNPLAWNGLANYYEKNNDQLKTELIKVYFSLLQTETNEKKLIEYCEKLSKLEYVDDLSKMVSAIYAIAKNENLKNNIDVWVCLANLISRHKAAAPDILQIYEEALSVLINTKDTLSVQYYAEYLNVLYKESKFDQLSTHAINMLTIFEKEPIALKWICKIFNEHYVETGNFTQSLKQITVFFEHLLHFEPNSPTALFTQSILLFDENKFYEAKEILTNVLESISGLLHGWILLMRCAIKLFLFNEASSAANKVLKFIQNFDRKFAVDPFDSIMQSLSQSDYEEDLEKCSQLLKENDPEREKYLPHIIRANIALGRTSEAEALLLSFNSCTDKNLAHLFRAQILHKQQKCKEALKILTEDVDMFEWWLEIGMLYWDLKEYDKCLMPFLKAARLEPNYFKCFYLLGNYYQWSGDFDKARRCYEKAFKLNCKALDVCLELSKIYRKLKNWDASLALLQSITSGAMNRKNSWAWLQLGLNYLEQHDYDKAISNLRFVIRLDDSNIHCWEALADGYLAKGAYTSALKCYERASQLSPSSFYPLLQMATVKQILCDYIGAQVDFDSILNLNKTYVPALKGTAETCLCQAKECYKFNRLGAARDHAQVAAKNLTVALNQRSDLSCLWKLFADTCIFITTLPEIYCCLFLPAEFSKTEGVKTLEKKDLFTLAAKCYCKALTLVDECLIWHDLGACYLSHAMDIDNGMVKNDLLLKAKSVAQHCTMKNPTYAQHWNLLGNVVVNSTPKDFTLAQHCFINAVIADNNNAISWCNLGTLYFILGDFKLANEAFSQAQRGDPNYVNSWIGQAILAETLAHEEAMDLFRHSTQLAIHRQGALGYAQWVCYTLKESPLDVHIYSIHNMHAIPVACDALTWYIEYDPTNGAAWNMLGILRERMGLKMGTCEAFKNAVAFSSGKEKDLAKINYGRSLVALGKYEEAIFIFGRVEKPTLNKGIGLALAQFKAKNYRQSYASYSEALNWLADLDNFQSDLLVALASMAYMFEGPEIATKLLFQSIQLKDPSPWGFYATLSLAILHHDSSLAALVLKELQQLLDDKMCLGHVATLSGYFYLLQANSRKGLFEVSKILHRYPDVSEVWLSLSLLLMRMQSEKLGEAAVNCANIALRNQHNHLDTTKVLCWIALSQFITGNFSKSLKSAQKAVHSHPNVAENWAILCKILEGKECAKQIARILKNLDFNTTDELLTKWITAC